MPLTDEQIGLVAPAPAKVRLSDTDIGLSPSPASVQLAPPGTQLQPRIPQGFQQPVYQSTPQPSLFQQALHQPTIRLPRINTDDPRVNVNPAWAAGMNKVLEGAEGLTTLPNLAMAVGTAGTGLIGQFLRAALPSYFGAQAVPQLAQAAGDASVKVLPKPLGGSPESFSPVERGESVGNAILPGAMVLGGAKAAMPVRGVPAPVGVKDLPPTAFPPAEPAPTIPLDVPKINEALQQPVIPTPEAKPPQPVPPPNEQPVNQASQQQQPSPVPQATPVQPQAAIKGSATTQQGNASPEELRVSSPQQQGELLNAPETSSSPTSGTGILAKDATPTPATLTNAGGGAATGPVVNPGETKIAKAEAQVDTNPSEAQKASGNYRSDQQGNVFYRGVSEPGQEFHVGQKWTTNPKEAAGYAGNGRVVAAVLDIKNPHNGKGDYPTTDDRVRGGQTYDGIIADSVSGGKWAAVFDKNQINVIKEFTPTEARALPESGLGKARLVLETNQLPKYAQTAVMRESMLRRTNEGGGLDAPDPFRDSRWRVETVPVESLKPGNEPLWPGGNFTHRGSMTKGPIVVGADGQIIDGNNRLHEAIRRGDNTVDIFREIKPSTSLPEKPSKNPQSPDQLLNPSEQANEQRLLQEAHAEPGGPTGIAHRVREKVAATGRSEPPVEGQGSSSADLVDYGDTVLTADPGAADRHMAAFENDPHKAISKEGFATARAKQRQLDQAAKRAEESPGVGAPQYEAAFKAASDWQARVKKMQTEWHAQGMVQQGEQDIDTGTFTGLRSAYMDDTGKDFTSAQAGKAQEVAKGVKTAQEAEKSARDKLFADLRELYDVAPELAQKIQAAREVRGETAGAGRAADKAVRKAAVKRTKAEIDDRVNPEKKVWAKVGEYLEKGEDDFDDVRHKVASDLGMPVKKVTDLLTANKRTKSLADDLWRKQEAKRRFEAQAKRWLAAQKIPGYEKFLASIPRTAFAAKVFGHGPVALGTHAPMVVFQPRYWSEFVQNFGKMYRMIGSREFYEMQTQDLLRNKNYITARRAGLQNDPRTYEEYSSASLQDVAAKAIAKVSPKAGSAASFVIGMGDRGYSVLKLLRQDMFDQQWDKLPDTSKTPEQAQAIADAINHITGVTEKGSPLGQGAHVILFAPRLMASRVMWLGGDPIRAIKTGLNWKNATEAQKYFAIQQAKEKAWAAGTMLSLLALNQGYLSASGSDQKINFTDPMKSDFLNFKAAGMRGSFGGPMVNMAKLPVKVGAVTYNAYTGGEGKLKNVVHPDENINTVIGDYARSQMSPFAGVIMDQLTGADFQRRPLPDSTSPVPKRLQAQGIGRYTWPEYLTQTVLPIPMQEAAREVWHHMGMNEEQIKTANVLMAAASIVANAGTGGRLSEDTQSVSPQEKQREQVAQKMFPGEDITSNLDKRAKVVEEIKKEAPGQPGEGKFLNQLPDRAKSYLKKEKVNVPTTQEEVTINKQQVPLNKDEQAYYDKLIMEKYTKYFNHVTQQERFQKKTRYDKQLQVDAETATLRKEARDKLKMAIQGKKVPKQVEEQKRSPLDSFLNP